MVKSYVAEKVVQRGAEESWGKVEASSGIGRQNSQDSLLRGTVILCYAVDPGAKREKNRVRQDVERVTSC